MIERIQAGAHSIDVLYLDNHVLGVVKPVNMPVQADASGDLDLLTALKRFIGERFSKPGAVYLGLVHRLDRPAGGSMVFARTSKAAARLSDAFARHIADKQYLCVARGAITRALPLTDWLVKDEATGMVRAVPEGTPGAKRAELTATPVDAADGLTLLRVSLMTGRAHQIRVQLAHCGHPLWGDARYGGGKPGEQLALWSNELTVPHPTQGTPLTLVSDPPKSGVWTQFPSIWGDTP